MSFPRYPNYKNSGVEWIGRVPSQWTIGSLKHFYSIKGGSTPKSDVATYWNGSIVWVTPADLSKISGFEIQDSDRRITLDGLNSCGTSLVPIDSVVLATRAPIGTLGIATTTLCTNQGCKSLTPRANQNSRFLAYALSISTEALNVRGRGTTFLELSADELGAFKLPFPDKTDQSLIVQFLDKETTKIDSLIAEQKNLINLLKEKRQAVISHAVTKGLDPKVKMKDSGVNWLGLVPEHWAVKKLKYISEFAGGGTPSRDNPDFWNGDIPWVSPKDMKVEFLESAEEKITQQGLKNSSSNLIEAGQILMVVRSGILKHTIPVAINVIPVAMNQDMKALKFRESSCRSEFFMRWVQGLNELLLLEWAKQGATVESIEHNYLKETVFPLPPFEEQLQITEYLYKMVSEFEGLMKSSEGSINLLEERRTALISAAVTGQIDVRNFQPKEVA